MIPTAIAWLVFACVFAGALLGMFLRRALPERHLNDETKDVVKVAVALVATMAALVLSLLLSSAKSSFDTRNTEAVQIAADIVQLDRVMAHYGPETKDSRALLRRTVAAAIQRFWPADGARPVGFDPKTAPSETLYDKLADLSPQTDAQRALQAQGLQIAVGLGHARLLLIEQMSSSIALPFLVMLIFWLIIIFVSFGLFAPANATVTAVFLVCAMSVSGAIFLILELDQPLGGMIQISSAPFRQALALLGQ